MSSLRQIAANRRHARKSTGPTSAAGKAVSSMNSLKSGIHGKFLPLLYGNCAGREQLIDEYFQSFHPASPDARSFDGLLIRCQWTLHRLDPTRRTRARPVANQLTSNDFTTNWLRSVNLHGRPGLCRPASLGPNSPVPVVQAPLGFVHLAGTSTFPRLPCRAPAGQCPRRRRLPDRLC